jgi:adenylate cyclase
MAGRTTGTSPGPRGIVEAMTAHEPPALSREELAELAGVDDDRIGQLVEAGVIGSDAGGRFAPADAHRVRIVDAFLEAGIPLSSLVAAMERDVISFAYYDQLHAPPGPLSTRTYGELKAHLGDQAQLMGQLVTALGLAEPDEGSRLPQEDETLLLELLDIVASSGVPDLGLRVARLFGDGTRRSMEAILTVYGEAVERLLGRVVGVPPSEVNERFLGPWNRYARMAPELGRWLTARHLSNAIDAFSVTASEEFLAAAGFVAPRDEAPPAIAFVDLAGFTRLTVERGDEPAALMALDFGQLADQHARAGGGRMVKLLGDGALLHFDSLADATEATLRLLAALPGAGFPAGHAGIDAGPIIVRDGDVFGRTVNRASRIADVADAGRLLAPATVAASLPEGRFSLKPMGPTTLSGIPDPVELVRITARLT